MDFCELAKERYSVRKFDSRPIEDEKLQKVLETGLIAPTAKNYQPFRIYVIKSEDTSIVATHVMMQAADLGLGTCWVNMFDPTLAAELFDIPETEIPLLLMPIGYASEEAEPSVNHTTKRPNEELVFYL